MRRGCVIPAAVSLAAVDLRRLARDEPADLTAFPATPAPRQRQAPTLCARWRVRDAPAHALSYDELNVRSEAPQVGRALGMETDWVCRCGRLWFPVYDQRPFAGYALAVAGSAIPARRQMMILAVALAGHAAPDPGCGDDLGGVVSVAAHTPLPCARIPT